MLEIGGYFGIQRFCGHDYHAGALQFNSARYAIKYVVDTRKFRKVFVPTFLCSSVAGALLDSRIQIVAYPITDDWLPDMTIPLAEDEVIIIVNYFGQLSNKTIESLRDYYRNVVIDNTQSFFQKPVEGVYTVYSCRKYFGVPDGGYLCGEIGREEYDLLPQDHSAERSVFLAGRLECGASAYYAASQKNEREIELAGPRKMSPYTQNMLCAVDYEQCMKKRRENIAFVNQHLSAFNLIHIENDAGLFMYPFLQNISQDLRNYLISLKIYTPKLWPSLSVAVLPDAREAFLSEKIVWLPIDQRYGLEDMEYMVNVVKSKCNKAMQME